MSTRELISRIREDTQKYMTDEYAPVHGESPDHLPYRLDEFEREAIEVSGKYVEITPKKPLRRKHAWQEELKNWPDHIANQRFLGLDGSEVMVMRDQLYLISARAGTFEYTTKDSSVSQLHTLEENYLYLIIDGGLLKEGTDTVSQFGKKALNGKPIYTVWNAQSDKNPTQYARGLKAKLRGLTEVRSLEKIPKAHPGEGVILIDGPLYPSGTNPKRDVLPVLKELDVRGYTFCGIVKRMHASFFVEAVVEGSHLSNFDPTRFPSDTAFLHRFLEPLESTAFFTYDSRLWNIGDEDWILLCTFIMTRQGNLFRVEMPAKYWGTKHEKTVKDVLSLAEVNWGTLPYPQDNIDRRIKYKPGEKRSIATSLDAVFKREKGIELTKPYEAEY